MFAATSVADAIAKLGTRPATLAINRSIASELGSRRTRTGTVPRGWCARASLTR